MTVIRQLLYLARLRWLMVRSRTTRTLITLAACLAPVAIFAIATVGQLLPTRRAFEFALLEPSVLLGFAVLAVIGPLAAGGGYELYPEDQLVVFAVRPGTRFLSSLMLTPINIAWAAQFLGLVGLTSYTTPRGPGAGLALTTALVFAACATLLGQTIAWFVVGVRQQRAGRVATWTLAALLGAGFAAVVASHSTTTLLDRSPTKQIVEVMDGAATGAYARWLIVTFILAACAALFFWTGVVACSWTNRRSGQTTLTSEAKRQRRRGMPGSPLRALLRTDIASVWRASAIRRGLLVLVVLPALAVATARIQWEGLVLLPGLLCSGTALLFGINAFSLDDSGAIWLASLPFRPRLALVSKGALVALTTLPATLTVSVAGVIHAAHRATPASVAALLAATAASIAYVTAVCLRLSVQRPHRAQLRGRRETPAPPGIMAAYSVRLAVSMTFLGLFFAGASKAPDWWLALLIAVPFLAYSARTMTVIARQWDKPSVRSRVVETVGRG